MGVIDRYFPSHRARSISDHPEVDDLFPRFVKQNSMNCLLVKYGVLTTLFNDILRAAVMSYCSFQCLY